MRARGLLISVGVVMALGFIVLAFEQAARTDLLPQVNLKPPLPPADVSYPQSASGDPLKMLPYFDDYSWRTFLAMVWPALPGSRGTPDARKTIAANAPPRVFDTFKSGWEVFHTDQQGKFIGGQPARWEVYDDARFNACSQQVQFGELVLASFSKFTDTGQAGAGTLDQWLCQGRCGPLMARNRTYIHYLTLYNPITFGVLRNWLGQDPRPSQVVFPAAVAPGQSALVMKSAWMDLSGFSEAQKARYYRRRAWVQAAPNVRGCGQVEVGLVGLHIVQRTLSRTQWIWSSFEQVDNVPPADPLGSDGSFAFYRRGAQDLPLRKNPYPPDPAAAIGVNFYNAHRLYSIHPYTQETNLAYRKALRDLGSVWQYYQLVLTQFPIPDHVVGVGAATPQNTFPGSRYPDTSFANITMETFHQDGVAENSCLGCHATVGKQTDFVWSVLTRTTNLVHGTESELLVKLQQLLAQ